MALAFLPLLDGGGAPALAGRGVAAPAAGVLWGGAAGGTRGSRWRRLRRSPVGSFPLGRSGGEAGPAADCGREGGRAGRGVLSHRAGPRAAAAAALTDGPGAVSPAASSAPTAMSGCRVFIGRLNPAAREKDVERFFKGYGRIRDIDLKRGFGFVVSVVPHTPPPRRSAVPVRWRSLGSHPPVMSPKLLLRMTPLTCSAKHAVWQTSVC